ncbi:MAG TPA: hypothetical protein VM369_02380 [Candidatus Binatia bacterium]|nr:hypothetical protein [Candidatus Binatia bacterium]
MAFLAATVAMLGAGPWLVALTRPRPRLARAVDAFVLAGIAALVAFEVLPEAWRAAGPFVLLCLVAGLFGPTVIERGVHSARRAAHIGTLALAIAGLVLHVLADGAVLAAAAGWALPLAVVLHTLPVGMAVWWLLEPHFGARVPTAALLLMALGTIAGYALGISLGDGIGERTWACFQALIAGSLLHVAYGRPHLAAHPH